MYYFGSYEAEFNPNKYNLLFEGAKFGDRAGFTALWIPERHFHAFGGFSPNPSVLAAALARETKQIQLRSGSVVLPLHHSIRVAEEWAVVDNLSQGRVGIAFASGWHPQDFVLAPQFFGQHRELMFQEIETVQKLWRGEAITVPDGKGQRVEVKTYPQPMQSQLPSWITIVNNPDTYIRAGAIGANILTNLMGQSVEDLARNIALYRQSLAEHGYDPASGTVTVLLHTFVGKDLEQVREQARQPFGQYLTSSVGLLQNMVKSQGMEVDFEQLREEDRDFLLASAYKRYTETSALIGTPETCRQIIDHLQSIGVDEVACFIDFGVDEQTVLANLPHLQTLKDLYQPHLPPYQGGLGGDQSPYQGGLGGDQSPYQGGLGGDQSPYQGEVEQSQVPHQVPLTEAQRQLWILAQLGDNGSTAYNQSVTLQLSGPLNLVAMTQAIQRISDRHEALRTKINAQGDSQEILPQVAINCPILDFSFDQILAQQQAEQWLKEESEKPFDLSQGSLVRWHLLKLEPELHLLVLTAHHIISDGWSMGVILRELGELYSAKCQGITANLKTPKQFRELIEWQTQPSRGEELKKQQAYWLTTLVNSTVLHLPTDKLRPALPSYQANRQILILDSQFTEKLKQFSRKQGCTFLMTLLSVYNILLHRLTGQDDILVGLPASGRGLLDSEGMVGYCTHLLPIRSQLVGNPTFADYLKQMRGVLLSAYEHQDYPFALLLNQLDLPRNTSRSPLIDVSFNLEPAINLPKMRELEVSLLPQKVSFRDRDLHLNVTEMGGEALVDCDYNTDLFEDETIQRWLGHFQTLLETVINDPQQNLRELPLLSPAERQQLLVDWNNTKTDYPQDLCIHQLFEAQVERTPDAIALVFEEQSLTYSELNCRANQLAHYLQKLGVKPNELVGICLKRSLDMIMGLLAVLKIGGAYVPIDPDYPQERISFMLQDTQVKVILTCESLQTLLSNHQAIVVCLDKDWQPINQASQENLNSTVSADNLAYIIYTSGSTGKPKGVEITHRSVNRLLFGVDYVHLDATQRFLQIAPIAFDASTFEIWGALLHGARCVIFTEDIPTATSLKNAIDKNGITVLWLTAALFNGIIDDNAQALSGIKQLLIGGEALSVAHVQKALAALPLTQIINGYGPTESTTFTCCYPIPQQLEETIKSIPIGRPIANTQVYILDNYLQTVPIGVVGELHIGGLGLARGYLNRPELTQEKFIANPFSNDPDSRLYKTGDLARYLPDGKIEYLGRTDNQVKIRGFRIELGEIEVVLLSHPQVREAVVLVSESDRPENRALVAYIVLNDPTCATQSLREFVKRQLPDYMVPAYWLVLEKLPLTSNGKIDRRALPLPNPELHRSVDYVAPVNSTQEAIAAIFGQVLKLEKVGIDDNFFEIGGNSLQATQVISRLRESFSLELPLRRLFEQPTVADLALAVTDIHATLQKLQSPIEHLSGDRQEIEL
ncbi:MupA/Atu3671 family FMN-dependent luciferase-like monooxygenase [Microcystis aeruginosa]|uniref:MupA/Atu3671 family FMN-dependent luciferase-like monooxygenase n=1 Tax=Microcystis aeruginosa TaxID=1126 RepID=UPI0023313F78|nr:MupA/Atu3671 family FMN-dependent luciferase-like monooxygenase [Microcystis aeruginosa]MDB9432748.1 amino acid adenylation domain-containing protein [Microcystis aeruginosa CS-552/01]